MTMVMRNQVTVLRKNLKNAFRREYKRLQRTFQENNEFICVDSETYYNAVFFLTIQNTI